MIPKFEQFLYPFIFYLKDGQLSLKDLRLRLKEHFNLSDEDVTLRTKKGTQTQFEDRIGWARQYFRRAQFIDIPQYGCYQLTNRAKENLKCHTDLTIDDLMQYPEFAEYNSTRNRKTSSATPVVASEISELTPTEQLEQAVESIEKDLAADLLQRVMEQTPAFFEHLVVDLLVKMGYGGSFADSAQVTQLSNDEGIDGIIYEDKLGLDKIYIQAKRWVGQVGRPNIQQFAGALVGQNATKGVFITTSSYSKDAKEYVKGLHQKIVLIDGQELAKFMIEYNVGVSTKKIYEVKRLDSDYFEE